MHPGKGKIPEWNTLAEAVKKIKDENEDHGLASRIQFVFLHLGLLPHLADTLVDAIYIHDSEGGVKFKVEYKDSTLTVFEDEDGYTVELEATEVKMTEIYPLIQNVYDQDLLPKSIHLQCGLDFYESSSNFWLKFGRATLH